MGIETVGTKSLEAKDMLETTWNATLGRGKFTGGRQTSPKRAVEEIASALGQEVRAVKPAKTSYLPDQLRPTIPRTRARFNLPSHGRESARSSAQAVTWTYPRLRLRRQSLESWR
jgi:hypothetical protein